MTRKTATLLISCQDQKGLVAAVSELLFRHGGNVIHADQHTDQSEQLFLQRVEWELDGFGLTADAFDDAFRPIADRFGMHWELRTSDRLPRLAILVSKQGHCLFDLLARWRMGDLKAELALVISNHPDLGADTRRFGVEFLHLPVSEDTRATQEQQLGERLKAERIDLVVLARYMQILSGELVGKFTDRIINIHHSFLPAFAGGRPYHQAHERGVKIIGATAHYVTPELDQGPIIEQDVVRVSHRDSVRDMVHKGRDLEKIVLSRAVDLHLRNRVLVYGNKTVVFD